MVFFTRITIPKAISGLTEGTEVRDSHHSCNVRHWRIVLWDLGASLFVRRHSSETHLAQRGESSETRVQHRLSRRHIPGLKPHHTHLLCSCWGKRRRYENSGSRTSILLLVGKAGKERGNCLKQLQFCYFPLSLLLFGPLPSFLCRRTVEHVVQLPQSVPVATALAPFKLWQPSQ